MNRRISIFLAAAFGDLFYILCVIQYPACAGISVRAGGVAASAVKFLGVFAPTQLPLANCGRTSDGRHIMIGLETYAKPELKK